MSDTERKALETFARIIPKLTREGQEKLLTLGEGIGIGAGVLKIEDTSLARAQEQETPGDSITRPA